MPFIPLGQPLPLHVRENVAPLRAVHSSFIVSSRANLRELGYFDAYVARLSGESRSALDTLPTGVFVPLPLARAHLEACDALDLSETLKLDMGRKLASRLHGPVIRLALRLAGAAGATPMFLAAKAVTIWPQRNQGGELLIVHKARREARVEILGYSLADIGYVRAVWRGNLEGIARVVIPTAQVTEESQACRSTTLVYSMVW